MPQNDFRIAVIGDFSGRARRPGVPSPSSTWRPVPVDRDNFDRVLAGVKPRLDHLLSGPDGRPVSIAWERLADFHPDQLLQAIPLFGQLRELRHKVLQRETFGEAAEAIRGWSAADKGMSETAPATPADRGEGSAAADTGDGPSLLDAAVEAAARDTAGMPVADDMRAWRRLVTEIARPFSQPNIQATQQQMVAAVDEAIGVAMRAILHHRAVREIESAWRALHFLVFRTAGDNAVKYFLIDVSRQELASDLDCSEWSQSRLHRILVEDAVGTPGGEPWSLVIGNFTVGPDAADAQLVHRWAELASRAGAPWIAGAQGTVAGGPGAGDATTARADDTESAEASVWRQLRESPYAHHVGLVWPRFLLRLPYGRDAATTKAFAFEELAGVPQTSDYLWGNGAFLAGLLIAQSFLQSGVDFQLGEVATVDRLPLHVHERDGEPGVQPCGEVLLSDRVAERVVAQGIMPLVSVRDQDVAGVPRFTSIALDGAPLAGRWRRLS